MDQLHVWLNGYQSVVSDLPQESRLTYHLQPENPGPWVRYRVADSLDAEDVLVTLDDDLRYPTDYISRGVSELTTAGEETAVCFGGFRWDPLVPIRSYGSDRLHYAFDDPLSGYKRLALLMGGVSFFQATTVKSPIELLLPGFRTNDDMMISYQLQRRNVRILCCPKPDGWIGEMDDSQSSQALFVRDSDVRYKTFGQMVEQLGFDPTAGHLTEFLGKPSHILVIAENCPPLPGSSELDRCLRSLCSEDVSVHLVAPVSVSQAGVVQRHVDVPYKMHAVPVPEPGGRLDWLPPIRTWRSHRVKNQTHHSVAKRIVAAKTKLHPDKVYWVGEATPAWIGRESGVEMLALAV